VAEEEVEAIVAADDSLFLRRSASARTIRRGLFAFELRSSTQRLVSLRAEKSQFEVERGSTLRAQ